jgi:hypothetical protein
LIGSLAFFSALAGCKTEEAPAPAPDYTRQLGPGESALRKLDPSEWPDVDVIKLEGFRPSKPIAAGQWWEGARAYVISPRGASKIIAWVIKHGAMPADWMLCDGIVTVAHDQQGLVQVRQNAFSFTRDLA